MPYLSIVPDWDTNRDNPDDRVRITLHVDDQRLAVELPVERFAYAVLLGGQVEVDLVGKERM